MDWIELEKDYFERLIENDYNYFIRELVGELRGDKIFRVHFFKTEREAFIRQTELRITNKDCWRQKLNKQCISMFYGMDGCKFYIDADVHEFLK